MKGKQTSLHEVSRGCFVPHALKSMAVADSVSSCIVMQIYSMIQCDIIMWDMAYRCHSSFHVLNKDDANHKGPGH